MRKMRMQSLPYARTCLYIRRPTRTPTARTGAAVNILQSAAEVIGNTFSGIPGAINTGDAVNITPDFATIINNSFSGIPGAISFVAVQYSTSPAMSSPTMAFGTIGSPFSVNLTTLQPNATYYYRAAVNYEGGAHYGQIKSFTTPDSL